MFELKVFEHHKNSTCLFWKSVVWGFQPDSHQFPPVSRPDFFQQYFMICPSYVFWQCTLDHGAGCISHTSQPVDSLTLQRVPKLPDFKIPASAREG
jgi:hypothetical protein